MNPAVYIRCLQNSNQVQFKYASTLFSFGCYQVNITSYIVIIFECRNIYNLCILFTYIIITLYLIMEHNRQMYIKYILLSESNISEEIVIITLEMMLLAARWLRNFKQTFLLSLPYLH